MDTSKPLDLTRFYRLEVGGCIDKGASIAGGIPREEAEFFTVYGRCHPDLEHGGACLAEAIEDYPSFEAAKSAAEALSQHGGLDFIVAC